MKFKNYTEDVELPDKVSASYADGLITMKGPKGEFKRTLYSPQVGISVQQGKVTISIPEMTRREKALAGTFRAHIKNMIKGVTEGHQYRLKICSGHFPMNVAFANNMITIKNFIGEKVPRTMAIDKQVSLKLDSDIIVIESIDKELVGRIASGIEKLTRRPGFDRRIFQDGIYIIEKDGKTIE